MAIEVDESGVALREMSASTAGVIVSWSWSSVERVQAFKRDLVVVDLICLQFSLAGGKVIEVDEEMKGFEALVAVMPQQLLGCPPFAEWWHPVAVPAFATNERVLYARLPGGAA